jgi:hypothetical protein
MTPTLGEYYLSESISIENKAIHLQETDQLSEYDIYMLLKNERLTEEVSLIVTSNLLRFLEYVVPKYLSCFSNSRIDGTIYFGVDDNCEITGIPYLSSIPQEEILRVIKDTILNNVRFSKEVHDIEKLYNVQVIELETSLDILSNDAGTYYKKYSENMIQNMTDEEDFRQRRIKWLALLTRYTQKLEKVLNIRPIRQELRQFMIDNGQDEDVQPLISILDSGVFIPLDIEVIYHERGNPKNIFYWATRFRDTRTDEVIKLKPIKPDIISVLHPRQILSNLSLSRYNFLRNGAKYYMIVVSIMGSIIDSDVEYRHPSYPDKWNYRKRVDNLYAGPSCI